MTDSPKNNLPSERQPGDAPSGSHPAPDGRAYRESLSDNAFGEGQDRYYGDELRPAPVEESVAPKPGGRRTAMVSAGAVAAVAVLGAGGYGLYRMGQDSDPVATPTIATSVPTVTEVPTPTPTPTKPANGVPPLTVGWQVNTGPQKDVLAAYDVPPTSDTFVDAFGQTKPLWRVSQSWDEVRVIGNASEMANLAAGNRPSFFREGSCKTSRDSQLAIATWVRALKGPQDPAEVNPALAKQWANAWSLEGDFKTHEKYAAPVTTKTTVNGGKTPAVQSRVTIPDSSPVAKECEPAKSEIILTTFRTKGSTASVVISRSLGVPNALSDADLDKVLSTVRPTT